MFERNIIDLVGLFVEAIRAYILSLRTLQGEHCGPGAPAHSLWCLPPDPQGGAHILNQRHKRVELLHCLRKDENKWGLFQVAPCEFPCLLLPCLRLDTLARVNQDALL